MNDPDEAKATERKQPSLVLWYNYEPGDLDSGDPDYAVAMKIVDDDERDRAVQAVVDKGREEEIGEAQWEWPAGIEVPFSAGADEIEPQPWTPENGPICIDYIADLLDGLASIGAKMDEE